MTLFITSSPFVENAPRAILSPANAFIDNIRQALPENPRVLFVCADPEDHQGVCRFAAETTAAFAEAGIAFSCYHVLDGRNSRSTQALLNRSDFVILSGGHVPTQNAFFQKIHLPQLLQDFEGTVMGISAGSMNCAQTVYAGPELEGEAIDPLFERWIPGLGLTDINIFPHFQSLKDDYLDGLRLIEDITFADSMGHEIIALNDGSYILLDDGRATLYGEAYRIRDGHLTQICADGESVRLR